MGLKSFEHETLNVAVIGASGGIGSAFVERLCASDKVKTIHAFSRSAATFENPKIIAGTLDLTDENTVIEAAKSALKEAPLDLIIVATGVLHDGDMTPEKALKDIRADNFEKNFAVNTIGPALVAKHFLEGIPKDRRSVFAAISARIGSIEDNRAGGWYGYRASKAALNMVLKTAAIETKRKYSQAVIAGLHPGTVDTDLSKPFQSNVPEEKLFTPAYSASCLLKVIDGLTPKDSGKVFAWDGEEIPY